MISINDIKDFYDKAIYTKLHGFIYSNQRVEYAWQNLNTVFNYIDPKRILEIGSGIGEISFRLSQKYPAAEFVGFDISERSVQIASDLFISPNLSFTQADSISKMSTTSKHKFDLIFLMDVYEHIDVSDRLELQEFIKNNITEDGFVFMSCPTPRHLSYLKEHQPSQIQPIDENISWNELLNFEIATALKLIMYKEVSVWKAGDYFHVLFSNCLKMQPFSDYNSKENEKSNGLKSEIKKKLRKALESGSKSDAIAERKRLVGTRLGLEILEEIETIDKNA